MATLTTPGTGIVVQQTRLIRATRERVFEAWTRPEILKQWFGPAKMHCPFAEMDVREGGKYRIDVHADPGTETSSGRRESTASGVFTQVVPNAMLQFTWNPSWTEEPESLVTVTLRDAPGGTEITLRHERLFSDVSCRGYEMGWLGSIEKLEALLEG